MKASRLIKDVTLKRNITAIILNFIVLSLLGLSIIAWIILTIKFKIDSYAGILIIMLIIYIIPFIYSTTMWFAQPQRATFTRDRKVTIEKEKLILNSDEVEIVINNEGSTSRIILTVILMGPILGPILLYTLGSYSLLIKSNKYSCRLYYGSKKYINILMEAIGNAPSNLDRKEYYYWIHFQDLKHQDPNKTFKSRDALVLACNLILIFIICLIFLNIISLIDSDYSRGLGIRSSPYIIETKTQFNAFKRDIDSGEHRDKYFALGANIDLEGYEHEPISINYQDKDRFAGVFDGRGYVLSNFKITNFDNNLGLFAYNYGTIKNLGIENFQIRIEGIGSNNRFVVGSIAAINYGSIENCYAKDGNILIKIQAYDVYAAGFVGYNEGAIKNSFTTVNVHVENSKYASGAGFYVTSTASFDSVNSFTTGNVRVIALGFESNARAGAFKADASFREGEYSYLDKTVKRTFGENQITIKEPSYTYDRYCTVESLNSKSFYTETLHWSEDIWDFSKLDFGNNILPILKKSG